MPAKKKELVEEATKPARKSAPRKKTPAKSQVEPDESAAALTPDLVMQMMAQMKEMSQELGKLREEVAHVKSSPAAAEIDEYLPDAVLEDPFTPDQLAEMEAQLDNFMETGTIPESGSSEVTAEETAALLAGLEEANLEIERADTEQELALDLIETQAVEVISNLEEESEICTGVSAEEGELIAGQDSDSGSSVMDSENLPDELIAAVTAEENEPEPAESPAIAELDELPDGLSEEELAAAIRDQIEAQNAPVLDAETGKVLAFSESSTDEEGGMMSPDEIASMLAASQPETPVKPESSTDHEGGMMSPDEIAAMLAASQSGTSSAPNDETVLSDAEIAAMVEANAPQGTALDAADENLSEEELAALIRGEIEKQDAPKQGVDASGDEDSGGNMSEDEIASMLANASAGNSDDSASAASAPGVLSAAELSALLNDGTPDAEFVPQTSTAMSDDELQKLMDEAECGQKQGSASFEASDVPDAKPFAQSAPAQAASTNPTSAARVNDSTEGSDLGALRVVPPPMAVRALALPLGFQDGKLKLMAAEPVDEEAIDRISKVTGFGVVIVKAPMDQVVLALRAAYIEIHDDQARKAILETSYAKAGLVSQLVSKFKKSA